jgi:hypothetical protein
MFLVLDITEKKSVCRTTEDEYKQDLDSRKQSKSENLVSKRQRLE